MGRGLATRGFLNAPPANLCAIVRERQFNSERWPRYGFSGATATERRPTGSIWRERERPSIPRAGGDQGAPLATRRRRRRIYAETAGIVPGSLVLIRILIGLPTGERPSLFNLADERVGGAVAKLFVQPWSGHCWPAAEVLDVEGLAASGGSGGHKAPAQLVVLPAQGLGQRRAGGVRTGTGGGKLGYTPSLALGCGHWAVPDSMAAHGDPPFVITK